MRTLVRRLFAVQPLDRLAPDHDGPRLRRALGWPGLVAIGLGTMLGGIFTTVGAGAAAAGPGVIVAFLLSGLASFFVALCYAEFASMVPIAGSAYTYAYATLGELIAWVIGWDLVLEYGISAAPVAASWSGYTQSILGSLGITLPAWAQVAHVAFVNGHLDLAHSQVDVLAFASVLILSCLLARGIRESASVNSGLVVLQVVSMIVFVIALLGVVHPSNFKPFAPLGWHGIVESSALVFFAYIGFDTVTVASEEAKNPSRDVPIGILLSLILGALLYVAISYVTVGVVPWRSIDQNAAMSQAINVLHNGVLSGIVSAGAIAGTTTVMITSLLGQTRIFFVMARDGMLPNSVARIHDVFRTPARMTMITGALVAILAALVPLDSLLKLVNIGTLSAFSIVCAGVLVLRYVRPDAKRGFRAPFGRLSAVAGCVLCAYMAFGGLGLATWIRFVAWFLLGILIYALYGFRHSKLQRQRR